MKWKSPYKDVGILTVLWALASIALFIYSLFHHDWFYLVAANLMMFNRINIVHFQGEED